MTAELLHINKLPPHYYSNLLEFKPTSPVSDLLFFKFSPECRVLERETISIAQIIPVLYVVSMLFKLPSFLSRWYVSSIGITIFSSNELVHFWDICICSGHWEPPNGHITPGKASEVGGGSKNAEAGK